MKIWAKYLNKHFYEQNIQMASVHIKKCSTSLAQKGIQIKTTMRYHFTPIRMTKIKKSDNNKCGWECEEIQIAGGNGKRHRHLGSHSGRSQQGHIYSCHMTRYCTLRHVLKSNENVCPHKNLYTNIYRSATYSS